VLPAPEPLCAGMGAAGWLAAAAQIGKFGPSLTSAPPASSGRRGGEDDFAEDRSAGAGPGARKDDVPAKFSSGWCQDGLLRQCPVSSSSGQGPLPAVCHEPGGQREVFSLGLPGRFAGGADHGAIPRVAGEIPCRARTRRRRAHARRCQGSAPFGMAASGSIRIGPARSPRSAQSGRRAGAKGSPGLGTRPPSDHYAALTSLPRCHDVWSRLIRDLYADPPLCAPW
jgi:hypothetical protein